VTGFAYIVAACFFWAFDTLIRYPLTQNGLSSLQVVSYEHFIFLLIFGYFLLTKLKSLGDLKLSHVFFFFMVGGLGSAMATLCFTRAFVFLNPSLVILLQKFQPIVAIVLANLILKEPIAPKFLLWASVCLIGGLFIGHNEVSYLLSNEVDTSSETAAFGYLFVFIAVFGWGASTVFGKKLTLLGYAERDIMLGRFFFGGLTLAPFFFLYAEPLTIPWDSFFKIGLMVLISGILALFLYYQGLKRVSARSAALAEMFFPLCAVIVNWIFLGKGLTPMQILGGVILITGSSVIQLKKY
jgi:drug/metabolite transporter (DMT)-like permease